MASLAMAHVLRLSHLQLAAVAEDLVLVGVLRIAAVECHDAILYFSAVPQLQVDVCQKFSICILYVRPGVQDT
jgi:hypothetical protein